MYTWQFIPTLMIATTNELLTKVYRYYHKFSIGIVLVTLVGLYISVSVIYANYYQLLLDNEKSQADYLSMTILKVK